MLRYPGMTPFHYKGLAHGSTNRWQAISHAAGCATVSHACDAFDPRDVWAMQLVKASHLLVKASHLLVKASHLLITGAVDGIST